MAALDHFFGTIIEPDIEVEDAPALSAPTQSRQLPTGFALLDTLVPIPRGGLVELRGGWMLVMLSELIGNLAAQGPAALIAVDTRRKAANGIYARLHRLVGPEATRHLVIVVACPEDREHEALRTAGRLARRLAADDSDVLLVLDSVASDVVGPSAIRAETGLASRGSVTGLRLGAISIDDRPLTGDGSWPEADAVIEFGIAELVRGFMPAIDLAASRSSVLEDPGLDPRHAATARKAHSLFALADGVRRGLSQPIYVGEDWDGHSTTVIALERALADLDALLADVRNL